MKPVELDGRTGEGGGQGCKSRNSNSCLDGTGCHHHQRQRKSRTWRSQEPTRHEYSVPREDNRCRCGGPKCRFQDNNLRSTTRTHRTISTQYQYISRVRFCEYSPHFASSPPVSDLCRQ
ncbi:hypothetical protein H9L39_03332 [Fusarium oxysporum f. sp. albedinis]|nr:hypothetical protein H9L39_03332 [Fusarium oxysporum f. sp. albedinis]